MANETQIAIARPDDHDDHEKQYYDMLTRQYGPGAPLPDPIPGDEWLAREAAGDPELLEFMKKEEALENKYGSAINKKDSPVFLKERERLLTEIAMKNWVKRVREQP